MTTLEAPALLTDAVRAKLQGAAAPLKLADVAKGLPKPKKMKTPEFQQEVRAILEEEVRQGRIFRHPSSKGGESRYWSRDEKPLLCDKLVEIATQPAESSKLKTAVGKVVKGTDATFVETLLRELIAEGRLFEHPAKTAKGKPLFGAAPPPPPLAQTKHKKAVGTLVAGCRKLLAATGASVEELMRALQGYLVEPAPVTKPATRSVATPDELILKAVANVPVLSLADLRREMPGELRGAAFDEAVLRLADARRVIISQDADPSSFTESQRAEYVRDGGAVFTTIARWS